MIVSTVMGGLGNQMFQYAAGRALSLRSDKGLRLDLGWFDSPPAHLTPRRYELDCFQIHAELCSVYPPTRAERIRELFGVSPRVWSEVPFRFEPRMLAAADNVRLVGYWMDERYFQEFSSELRGDFAFHDSLSGRNRELAERIRSETAVSVHVRRKDYVTNRTVAKFHGSLDLDYYLAAGQRIIDDVRDPHFFIFSDDPDWCRANLDLGGRTTYVDHNSRGSDDLRLMSMCSHHVIANSSFSWWGAWLNPRDEKLVVAPARWVADRSVDTSRVVPDDWLRV